MTNYIIVSKKNLFLVARFYAIFSQKQVVYEVISMIQNQEMENRMLFLMFYARLRNIKEAGMRAGFSEKTAYKEGVKILNSVSSAKKLEKLSSKFEKINVRQGFERIAFGEVNDVAELVFAEEPLTISEIARLDLFNVSEMKKVKGGGVEVKLFDRQKALEKLLEIENSTDTSATATSFFNALREGAKEDFDAEG